MTNKRALAVILLLSGSVACQRGRVPQPPPAPPDWALIAHARGFTPELQRIRDVLEQEQLAVFAASNHGVWHLYVEGERLDVALDVLRRSGLSPYPDAQRRKPRRAPARPWEWTEIAWVPKSVRDRMQEMEDLMSDNGFAALTALVPRTGIVELAVHREFAVEARALLTANGFGEYTRRP